MTTPLDIKKLLGARMVGKGGDELGTIEQVFFDDATGVQEWARLRMGGLLGGKDRFVPLMGGSLAGKDMSVPYDKQKVKDSPELIVDRHITPEQESRLRAWYGLETRTTTTTTTTATAKTATAAAAGVAGVAAVTRPEVRHEVRRDGDLSLMRSEERIHFRTEEIETGRVRLHKYVDVVPVEERVRLMHEEFELERLPITDGHGGDIREDSVEVVLRGQTAYAMKEVVGVERVRLNVRQVPEERVIRDEIRRERIEVERLEATHGGIRTAGMAAGGQFADRAGNMADRAGDAIGDAVGDAKDAMGNAIGKVKGMFDGK